MTENIIAPQNSEILVPTAEGGIVTADESREREKLSRQVLRQSKVEAREAKRRERIAKKRGKVRGRLNSVRLMFNQADAKSAGERFLKHVKATGTEMPELKHDNGNSMFYVLVNRDHPIFQLDPKKLRLLDAADRPTPMETNDGKGVFLAWVYDKRQT